MALRFGPRVHSNSHVLVLLGVGQENAYFFLQCDDPDQLSEFPKFLQRELLKIGINAEISFPTVVDNGCINAHFCVPTQVSTPPLFLRRMNRKIIPAVARAYEKVTAKSGSSSRARRDMKKARGQ